MSHPNLPPPLSGNNPFDEQDAHWMRHALQLADLAAAHDEVPVGAVIVRNGEIIGEGWNQPICSHDPTAHAEVLAMRRAAEFTQNYRLVNSTLYVTLEPCAMCVGAALLSGAARLVFGAHDPKRGACGSVVDLTSNERLNRRLVVTKDVLAGECHALIRKATAGAKAS